MGVLLDYKDDVQLVMTEVSSDGYGMEVVKEVHEVTGLFLENVGVSHSNYQTNTTSDAEVYLDPCDQFVIDNAYRLEGMYVVCNRYGGDDVYQWYRITQVIIGEDKLLGNEIDNVSCQLKKSSEVPGVS